jgi:Protein of unknown function (DUF4019)
MSSHRTRHIHTAVLLYTALLLTFASIPFAQAADDEISYPTVAAAFDAVKVLPGIKMSAREGWTIVEDDRNKTIWSFTPPKHPAHPAAIRRILVTKDGKVGMSLSALCEASKAACDKMMEDFETLNKEVVKTMNASKQPATTTAPAPASTPSSTLSSTPISTPAAALPPPSALSEADRTKIEKQLEEKTLAYFALRDGKKYREAFAQLSEALQKTLTQEKWSAPISQFNTQAGAVISRTVKKVTLTQDPPGAAPGVYAAVEYTSKFPNIALHCGYVVWKREASEFKLIREEVNMVDAEKAKTMSPEALEAVRKKFKC